MTLGQDHRHGSAERIADQIKGLSRHSPERAAERIGSLLEVEAAVDRRRSPEAGQVRGQQKPLGVHPTHDLAPDSLVGADAVKKHERLAGAGDVDGDLWLHSTHFTVS